MIWDLNERAWRWFMGAGLPFPVALADPATTAGKGFLERIHTVPSVVVLDPEGYAVCRKVGGGSPTDRDRWSSGAAGPGGGGDR